MASPGCLSEEDWRAQVEEVLALQAIYTPEDFRILAAPGQSTAVVRSDSSGESSHAHSSSGCNKDTDHGDHELPVEQQQQQQQQQEQQHTGYISAEDLLAAGPPLEVLQASCASTQCLQLLVCEALVHVDVPAQGLQVVLELPSPPVPQTQLPQQQQQQQERQSQLQKLAAAGGATRTKASAASAPLSSVIADDSTSSKPVVNDPGQDQKHKHGGAGTRGNDAGKGRGSGGKTQQRGGRGLGPASKGPPPPSPSGAVKQLASDPAAASAAAASLTPGQPRHPNASTASTQQASTSAPAQHPASGLVPFGVCLHHLSPVRVVFTLPPDYPSASPPKASLSAMWLSAGQSDQLQQALLDQWSTAAGPGCPALYTLLDWVKACSLQHLGITRQLVLGPEHGMHTQQQQAKELTQHQQQQVSPEALAVQLMRYAARREYQLFAEANWRCAICFEDFLGAKCVRLPECGDYFCRTCITQHLRTQLGQGAVDKMTCPQPSCRRPLQPLLLQQLLSPEEFERWEHLLLQRTLEAMEDAVYCPRCKGLCLEDKDHCVQCPQCFFAFCSLCDESWHPGSRCMDTETKLRLLEARRAGGSDGLTATERAKKELAMINELKSLALLKETSKACPTCGMGISKNGGCNKMTCAYCGTYFCYICNALISGYDHFSAGRCALFDQQEIDAWNMMANAIGPYFPGGRRDEIEARRDLQALRAQNNPAQLVRLCPCPVCGQANLKEGNNNAMRCWACNCHFCYRCRAWLRGRPGAHFGPRGCPQHSND